MCPTASWVPLTHNLTSIGAIDCNPPQGVMLLDEKKEPEKK